MPAHHNYAALLGLPQSSSNTHTCTHIQQQKVACPTSFQAPGTWVGSSCTCDTGSLVNELD